MAKVYVVTVFDSGDGKTEPWKVTESKDEAFQYAWELNDKWQGEGDYSEVVVSVYEFESRLENALKEIITIAEPHAKFTLTYEKICNVARKALGVSENDG